MNRNHTNSGASALLAITLTALALSSFATVSAADQTILKPDGKPPAVKSVRLILPAQPGPVVEHIGQVVARQIQQRCEAKVVKDGEAPLTVELALAPGISAGGYAPLDPLSLAGSDRVLRLSLPPATVMLVRFFC